MKLAWLNRTILLLKKEALPLSSAFALIICATITYSLRNYNTKYYLYYTIPSIGNQGKLGERYIKYLTKSANTQQPYLSTKNNVFFANLDSITYPAYKMSKYAPKEGLSTIQISFVSKNIASAKKVKKFIEREIFDNFFTKFYFSKNILDSCIFLHPKKIFSESAKDKILFSRNAKLNIKLFQLIDIQTESIKTKTRRILIILISTIFTQTLTFTLLKRLD